MFCGKGGGAAIGSDHSGDAVVHLSHYDASFQPRHHRPAIESLIGTRHDDVPAAMGPVPNAAVLVISHPAVMVGPCAIGQNNGAAHRPHDRPAIARADNTRSQRGQNKGRAEQMLEFHSVEWIGLLKLTPFRRSC